jgi:hypothetical protein
MVRGTVFERPGSWGLKAEAGLHPETGKRRQVKRQGVRAKREAEQALCEVQKNVFDGTVEANSTMRLDDFLDEWQVGQKHPRGPP